MTEPLHTVRFPGESDEYRRARGELLEAEIDLRRRTEAVAAKRRTLPWAGPCRRLWSVLDMTPQGRGTERAFPQMRYG
jgi:predicted dithiol-disulfide oxidoreductase (DUF899 family)